MISNELLGFISGGSAVGLLSLILWIIKVKRTIKAELVDPEVQNLREKISELKKEIENLKQKDVDLDIKLDKKLDSVKQSLSETNQSIAKMQGSLDLLIKQLEK